MWSENIEASSDQIPCHLCYDAQERDETTKSWGTELENVSKAADLVVRVMKTPKEEKLRQWYELMLKKASNEGIVVGHNNFYDQFFVPKREENIKIIAARLPYLDDATMVKGAIFTTITSSFLSECSFKRGKRLESDQSRVDCKQEKKAHKEHQIVIRSVKGNHDVERLKLSSLPYSGYEYMLESDDVDSKQENEKDVDKDESHLLNLPLYVLSMVIEFSVGVEYLKFRSTCKRCYLAAPLISWNNEKASKRLQV
nr:Toll/interleukin-1 receptor (TIR) domain-containing protein [Tanacetum cinerariifolium]